MPNKGFITAHSALSGMDTSPLGRPDGHGRAAPLHFAHKGSRSAAERGWRVCRRAVVVERRLGFRDAPRIRTRRVVNLGNPARGSESTVVDRFGADRGAGICGKV
jgi:hypothetical protein